MKLFAHLELICQWTFASAGTVCASAQRREKHAVQGVNTLRFIVVAGCLFISLVTFAQTNKVNGVINFQGDTVHLELMGRQNWDYDVKRMDSKGKTVSANDGSCFG